MKQVYLSVIGSKHDTLKLTYAVDNENESININITIM